jgi:uncharacterized membrane protein YcaP (DUF421 family)
MNFLFGQGRDLNCLQMIDRGIVIFFLALIFIRIAGRRSFGMRTSFDNIITLLLGATLSRAVVGASAFIPTICVCLVFVFLHRACGWLSCVYPWFERLIKGEKILVVENGKLLSGQLHKAQATQADLMEGVRLRALFEDLNRVQSAYVEMNGEISVVKKSDGLR